MIDDRIHIEISGHPDKPPLILHHALGANLDMWRHQLDVLEPHFRVIRMDMRGHGKSLALPSPYSMEELAGDVVLVMDALGIERSRFLGLSIGGMVGQALALNHPDRLECLVISNTTSQMPVEMGPLWDGRIQDVVDGGMETQIAMTLSRWFTDDYAQGHGEVLDWISSMVLGTSPEGFVGCCEAIKLLDFTDRLGEIDIPCLIIAGGQDPGIPPEKSEEIHERVRGSRLEIIEEAAHLSNVQAADEFNKLVLSFLKD